MKAAELEIFNWFYGDRPQRARVCYCADMSDDTIIAARVTRADSSAPGGVRTESWLAHGPEGDRMAPDLKRRGAVAVGCVPVQESLTLWLTAPFPSVAKARKVFPSLLDIKLPFPLEKCVYQLLDIRKMPDNTVSALAVAARQESVQELLERYHSAGFDPELLDHEGLALWTQSVRESPSLDCPVRVVLYLATDRITIAIGREGRFGTAHSMRRNSPCESSANSIADQIQRYIRPEADEGTPVQWMFCGPCVEERGLAQSLHDRLAGEWPGPLQIHRDPGLFLLRALGARALRGGPLHCNMRRGGLIHPNIARKSRRAAMSCAAIFLAAGLILCGFSAAWHIMSARRIEQANRAVADMTAQIAPGERIPHGMELSQLGKVIERMSETEAPFLEAFMPSLVSRLAEITAAGNECKLAFESLELRKHGLLIAGTAEDWDLCEVFAQRVRAMGYAVSLDRREAAGEGPIRFELKGGSIPR